MKIKRSYIFAAAVLALLVGYFVLRGVLGGGEKKAEAATPKGDESPIVQVALAPETMRPYAVTVRGRTQALHAVDVRAEVEGVVKAIHFDKGQKVRAGDVLCEIGVNDRAAKVAQMNAMVAQTGKELDVAKELFAQGFRSKTQLAQAEAAYEAAKAGASTSRT